MEIGVGTILYEFSGKPLSVSVERIASFGIKYIDVLAFGIFNPALYPLGEQMRIAKIMERNDVRASSIITCGEGNLASDDKQEREKVLKQLKLAAQLVKELGGNQILIGKGVGNIDFHLSRERAENNAIILVKEFADWCLAQDIVITFELEPEWLHVCNSIQSMKRLIDKVGAPNIGANMDIGHLNILRTRPDECECLKDKIIHVHISDNNGLAHTNCVIGEGSVDVAWYIDQYIKWGVDDVAAKFGVVPVAAIEVGEPGEYITDSDMRLTKSYGHVLLNVAALQSPLTDKN